MTRLLSDTGRRGSTARSTWPMNPGRMRRAICLTLLCACALLVPGAAAVTSPTGRLTGKITALGQFGVTIQTPGPQIGLIDAMTKAANALTADDYPYVWGGGHAVAGVASTGDRGGPGANGKRLGYDCSGAVAAVLEAAGLWPAGYGVPNDAGVIQQLLAQHLIARGAAAMPDGVTLYDHPGVHIFMNIDGRFFGTSDGGGGGDAKGGPGWLDDGAPDVQSRAFKQYHLLPSVLRDRTAYGHIYGFQTPVQSPMVVGAEVGEKITVSYSALGDGGMAATAVVYAGERTLTGTITAITPDEIAVSPAGGQAVTLATALVPQLLTGLAVGDGVDVTYSRDPSGLLVPHALTVVSTPPPVGPTGASGPTGPTGLGGVIGGLLGGGPGPLAATPRR